MKQTVQHLLAEANAVIDTVTVHDAVPMLGDPDTVFIDIRDETELSRTGKIQGAVSAPRGHLEFYADPATAMHNPVFASGKRLLLYCASGGRSTLAAKTLYDMGIPKVAHIAGGFAAWNEAGGPVQSCD